MKTMPRPGESLPSPFTFSQSSLQDYVDCPRRFQLHYIQQVKWPAIESASVAENERHQIEGQIFHRMIQQYYLGLPAEKIATIASTESLRRWWENFIAHGPKLDGFETMTELSMSARIGKHRIMAKYDLVASKDNHHAIVYDWKTYRKRPKRDFMADRLQTKVYFSLLHHSGGTTGRLSRTNHEKVEMVYWFAEFPSSPEVFTSPVDQSSQTWQSLEQIVNEIDSRQSFPLAEEEKFCSLCIYRSFCDRGIRAGEDLLEVDTTQATGDIDLEQIQEIEF
jgi:CRISPR/Cas system-associated exonuclease Cas4 (RecB family)